MRTLAPLGLTLAGVLALAACTSGGGGAAPSAGAGSPAPSAGAVTSGDLDGRTFLSTGASGHDLAPGSEVRLSFEGVRLGASAGCNQMSGEYEVSDGVLKLGMMAMTEMACEEPLMSQDAWLAAFLPDSTVSLAGDELTLAKDGVTLTLLDEETANPDRPLEGTRWVVEGIVARDAVSGVPAGASASLTLEGGTVEVDAGCNTGSGGYTIADDRLVFSPIGTTKKACEPEVMALETAVLQVLSGEAVWTIEADTLTLTNGANGLVLRAGDQAGA